jgi:hypothetical protein
LQTTLIAVMMVETLPLQQRYFLVKHGGSRHPLRLKLRAPMRIPKDSIA